MKIKLPELPPWDVGIKGQIKFAYSEDAMQAYASQAIREFVEGLEVVAGLFVDPQTGHRFPIGHSPNVIGYGPNVKPLIIKPELDDAE